MFEEELMKSQIKLLSLCNELCSNAETAINVYIYYNESEQYFNVFFQRKNSTVKPKELTGSEKTEKHFFQLAYEDIALINSVYKKHNQSIPIHSQLVYDLRKKQYRSFYIYKGEKESSIKPEMFFDKWIERTNKSKWIWQKKMQ